MKIRFSFALRLLLPYLFITALFLLVFFRVRDNPDPVLTLLSACGVIFTPLLGLIQVFSLRRPFNRIRLILTQLTRGQLPAKTASGSRAEIGELEQNLGLHVERLRSLALFARSLASGKYSNKIEMLHSDDEMGSALQTLKDSLLLKRKESESRRRDEENRNWASQGLAKFSKLFRETEDDLSELAKELIKELVAYTVADVGALFIAESDGSEQAILKLFGSYAFDREKFIDQSYEFGEGLVGRAALEKDMIYITDLPPGYMSIRSGLGEDVPSSLLLIPVILDDSVLGVIELASLGEIPAFQAGFIQQLADALATTIARVLINEKNMDLLEQSRKQSEELEAQEKLQEEIDRLKKKT